jgi:hypothetical protein
MLNVAFDLLIALRMRALGDTMTLFEGFEAKSLILASLALLNK